VTSGFAGTVPVDIGRDDAAAAARDELSRPEYAAHRPSLTQQVVDWVWHVLGRILDAITSVAPGGVVGLVVIALVLALVVVVVAFRVGPLRTRAGADRVVFGGVTRSAAEHRADADRAAAAGDWDEAVRQRFRGLVRALEERDVLDQRPGRTADEAAADAARSMPASSSELAWAARRFDDVAYGGEHATGADYRRLATLDETAARTPVVVA
jgi:hypothetical protein